MKDSVTDVERWRLKEGRELEIEQACALREALFSPDSETLLLINVYMHLTLDVYNLPT